MRKDRHIRKSRPGATPGITAALLLVLAVSCSGPEQDASDVGLQAEAERGPVTVKVSTDRAKITVAESLTFTVEAVAGTGCEVEFPENDGKLGEFTVREIRKPRPALLESGKTVYSRIYRLDPFLPGMYELPPLSISYRDQGGTVGIVHEIETPALEINVVSLLGDVENPELNDIEPPVKQPRSLKLLLWLIPVILAAIAGVIALYRRGRNRAEQAFIVPPHERALRRLWELESEDLPGRGLIKEFYERVSDILRRYIEERFGLNAPEQTTEEFLESLEKDQQLEEKYRPLLRDFLNHCDLVKFAAFQPDGDQIKSTFDSCKQFVYETRRDIGDSKLEIGGEKE